MDSIPRFFADKLDVNFDITADGALKPYVTKGDKNYGLDYFVYIAEHGKADENKTYTPENAGNSDAGGEGTPEPDPAP